MMGGVAFSIELLLSFFWGKTVLHIYGQQTYQNVCTADEKQSVPHSIIKIESD